MDVFRRLGEVFWDGIEEEVDDYFLRDVVEVVGEQVGQLHEVLLQGSDAISYCYCRQFSWRFSWGHSCMEK